MSAQKDKLKSTNALNLTVLQRADSSIKEILFTVAHVVAYEFDVESLLWKWKDVEGSLFVVKRDTKPQLQIIVMNWKKAVNLVENLLEDFEYEVKLPYLYYRNASQEVNGIGFYDDRECETVAKLLSRYQPPCTILNSCSKISTTSKVSPAKSKLEEVEAVLSPSVTDGPVEQSSSSINTNNADIQEDPYFINSFNTAMRGASNATISGQPLNSMATAVSPSSPQGVARPTLPRIKIPSNMSGSRSIMAMLKTADPNTKPSTNLVTPFLFSPVRSPSPLITSPVSPSLFTEHPLNNTLVNMHRTHSAPSLQTFLPPTQPPSLTPTSLIMPFSPPVISREKVREALQLLVQENDLIDMVYQAVMKGQH